MDKSTLVMLGDTPPESPPDNSEVRPPPVTEDGDEPIRSEPSRVERGRAPAPKEGRGARAR
jgi:hypothetical protein